MSATPLPKGAKPVGVIENPKPRLYVYDHCPYCVRARMILGRKGLDHELVYLANDNTEIPESLIGKKAVPILELGRPGSDDHEVMAESLDIVRRLDEDPAFGPPVLRQGPMNRPDIDSWYQSVSMVMKRLNQPRYATTPLPEFQTKSARETYIRRHPLPE
ncbi:unnamed protein product, partial [Choristocarpus tenellus]